MSKLKTFITIDFETTGLDPVEERITQIAAIKMVVNDENCFSSIGKNEIREFEKFVTLVNPGKEISPYITELTGIDNEKVKAAPTENIAIANLIEFINNSENPIIVAQNAPFDLGFLHHASLRADIKPSVYDFYCTRTMAAVLFPNISHRLADMVKLFDIELNNAHDALYDSYATVELFTKLKLMSNVLAVDFKNKLVQHKDRKMLFEPLNKIIVQLLQVK